MNLFGKIVKQSRQKSKPSSVSASTWANAVNWNIEAWRCYLAGQNWVHTIEICCPEQYYMLVNEKGEFILSNSNLITFQDNLANREWANRLKIQIAEMRSKGEWNEAIEWSKLLVKLTKDSILNPNERALIQQKHTVKGHRLIRINAAA
tara:strand:+ start:110549 stop:110995 length:447 start_codon:yes stop_codon:yes gene_type:complete